MTRAQVTKRSPAGSRSRAKVEYWDFTPWGGGYSKKTGAPGAVELSDGLYGDLRTGDVFRYEDAEQRRNPRRRKETLMPSKGSGINFAKLWEDPKYVALHERKDELARELTMAEHGERVVAAPFKPQYAEKAAELRAAWKRAMQRVYDYEEEHGRS